jgi:hypothetical protein
MDDDVSFVLHSNEPVKPVAVNTELSQLFSTVTAGATGIVFGSATPLAGELLQPFTDCVTVYIPGFDTLIDEEVAPLLHNKEPVKSTAVSIELPQLLVTVTVGVATFEFIGAAVPLAALLVHPSIVWVTV